MVGVHGGGGLGHDEPPPHPSAVLYNNKKSFRIIKETITN
jgi:hypothetical protein